MNRFKKGVNDLESTFSSNLDASRIIPFALAVSSSSVGIFCLPNLKSQKSRFKGAITVAL